ncbi:DNA/RNA non-specific endonuclease [Flavobacterium sp. GT3R68]|uniref:DNA/RNA non-specific endonuclease n=1 Tax=Flavobacterium sp. GT3R68 TaxID=2594437 RepID=UPI000F86D5A2|nr:DNA/RNA non-specific endonuclease [Flavobacterium sp. GT3R68]RTY92448.1 DNA/RNA non-specific endonuclease [Flavobacterium sp. GSN2]TRW94073.1 DNA/RNA non-specific endonuclease [Flavobacterium sp. GT3R68]
MKKISSLFILLFLILSLGWYCRKNDMQPKKNTSEGKAVVKSEEEESNFVSSSEISFFELLPTSTSKQMVFHDYYVLSYVEQYEQAEWVAYQLKRKYTVTDFKRPFFIADPKVRTHSADWRNYKRSGYDKGHLCPAGDMKFSKQAFEDTFYTSNISPQLHDFNDGVWSRLEQKARYWAVKYDGLYVITGGVLKPGLLTIGQEKVAVPDYFYKIFLNTAGGKYKMIAFLVPHQASEKPLYEFVVSVDAIEKMTGINFFPKLDDALEDTLEKGSSYKNWSF